MQKTIQLSLLLGALLSQLHAQEITLTPLEITSTAIKTDELKSTDAVEVYTQKDIEAAHVQNVYEFLNQQTSVITMPSYGNPFSQKIDMRGFGIGDGYENIVIKVNGRRLNNIDGVPQLLASISPDAIEKIEIIKASGIVEAGDGANAGVINIITKKSNNAQVGFYTGSYNTFDGTFNIGHIDDKLSYNLNGEAQKHGGIRYIDSNGNKDENKFSNFGFDVAYKALENLELRANGLTSDINVWYASSLTLDQYNEDPTQKSNSFYSGVHQKASSDVIGAGITYDINDALSLDIDYNHEYKTSNYITYSSEYKYSYNSADMALKYIKENFEVIAGGYLFDGDRKGATNITGKKNQAAFVKTNIYLGASTLKAGYRYENVSYKYAPTAGITLKQDDSLHGIELGYNYMLNKEQSLFLNYAKSYQAPNIDRFFNYGGTFNQFIKPSKSDSYTLGYNIITKTNKLKISAYYINMHNEIYYYADPTFLNSKNTNLDKSHKYGFDVYDKYLLSQEISMVLNYNYVKAIIDDEIENGNNYSGNELPGVSNHNVKATLNYLPNKFATLALTEVYRSNAYAANDFNNNLTQKQEAYTSTDVSATYAKDNWEVFAKINNLFNQKNGLWIRDNAIYPVNFTTTAIIGFKLKY
ncbi:TonB-dependent receptor [Sulfurimonas autotrophica]|uniref:TonB-dependent receptor plug n=1 Tax=Sulfurimonas autotrophica (strain ATCC BAA-671 / DSM 16294 / JCM 11897 / OK10) TaxID=563040 RepID=E0USW6_SULAO|nr:TonB-dependent receptor [Sulfurimonas autotrophica]ADN08143.1 TonB-dependent receptor plug [Sulfurimonas autotrophica DSM 16294]